MTKIISTLLIMAAVLSQASAQSTYVEFKMAGDSGVLGTTKVYTKDGNSRSEVNMASPQVPGGFKWITITLKDKPLKAYTLNENTKTYSEMDLSPNAPRENDSTQFDITILGKEKVNGYNCTHVKVQRGNFPNEEELWVSTEVLNYKQYMNTKTKYTTQGMMKALAAKGALGFPVRTLATERGKKIQIDLVKMEQRDNPSTLFSLDGYNKAGAPGGMTGASQDVQDAMKKIQNMTPEERQKFIEELRKKQVAPPSPPH